MGTITKREAKTVISDLLTSSGVPRGLWSITPAGELNILIVDRKMTFYCGAKLSYYQVKALVERVNQAIVAYKNRPDHRQIDLENCIKQAGAAHA